MRGCPTPPQPHTVRGRTYRSLRLSVRGGGRGDPGVPPSIRSDPVYRNRARSSVPIVARRSPPAKPSRSRSAPSSGAVVRNAGYFGSRVGTRWCRCEGSRCSPLLLRLAPENRSAARVPEQAVSSPRTPETGTPSAGLIFAAIVLGERFWPAKGGLLGRFPDIAPCARKPCYSFGFPHRAGRLTRRRWARLRSRSAVRNFIVNTGGATAREAGTFIGLVRKAVRTAAASEARNRFGIGFGDVHPTHLSFRVTVSALQAARVIHSCIARRMRYTGNGEMKLFSSHGCGTHCGGCAVGIRP